MVTERDGPGEPRIDFKDAYYIKLGRKGIWEASSISKSRLRFGRNNQSLDDINNARWDIIRDQLSHEHRGKSKVATRDSNALQRICESTPQDVWITFFDSKLWWCRVGEAPIGEDSVSRYRELQKGWSCSDLNGEPLHINRLPGDLSKTQAFRGTVCRVRAKESLWRVLNHEPSREYEQIDSARKELAGTV